MNSDKILMYVGTALLVLGWVCTLIAGRPKLGDMQRYRRWMYASITLFIVSTVVLGIDLFVVR